MRRTALVWAMALALVSGTSTAFAQAVGVGPGFDQLGVTAPGMGMQPTRSFPVTPGDLRMSAPPMTGAQMGVPGTMLPSMGMPKMGRSATNPAVEATRTQVASEMSRRMGSEMQRRGKRMGQRRQDRVRFARLQAGRTAAATMNDRQFRGGMSRQERTVSQLTRRFSIDRQLRNDPFRRVSQQVRAANRPSMDPLRRFGSGRLRVR